MTHKQIVEDALNFYAKEDRYQTPLYNENDLNNVGMPWPDKGHEARDAIKSLDHLIDKAELIEMLEGFRHEDLKVGGATQRTYGQNEGQNILIDTIIKELGG